MQKETTTNKYAIVEFKTEETVEFTDLAKALRTFRMLERKNVPGIWHLFENGEIVDEFIGYDDKPFFKRCGIDIQTMTKEQKIEAVAKIMCPSYGPYCGDGCSTTRCPIEKAAKNVVETNLEDNHQATAETIFTHLLQIAHKFGEPDTDKGYIPLRMLRSYAENYGVDLGDKEKGKGWSRELQGEWVNPPKALFQPGEWVYAVLHSVYAEDGQLLTSDIIQGAVILVDYDTNFSGQPRNNYTIKYNNREYSKIPESDIFKTYDEAKDKLERLKKHGA